MKNLIYFLVIFIGISACEKKVVIDLKAEGEKVMETSRQWANSQSSEEYISYWTADAILKSPKQPILSGHEQIMQMLKGAEDISGFSVDWEPKEVFVAKSGDLAYLIEDLSFSMNDSLGNPMSHDSVS